MECQGKLRMALGPPNPYYAFRGLGVARILNLGVWNLPVPSGSAGCATTRRRKIWVLGTCLG
eukprot:15352115-Alexandrium_andersonii.AAC.1